MGHAPESALPQCLRGESQVSQQKRELLQGHTCNEDTELIGPALSGGDRVPACHPDYYGMSDFI